MMLDADIFVQESACTALVHAIENCEPDQLIQHVGLMIEAFKHVIDTYTGASLVALLDAIG